MTNGVLSRFFAAAVPFVALVFNISFWELFTLIYTENLDIDTRWFKKRFCVTRISDSRLEVTF